MKKERLSFYYIYKRNIVNEYRVWGNITFIRTTIT